MSKVSHKFFTFNYCQSHTHLIPYVRWNFEMYKERKISFEGREKCEIIKKYITTQIVNVFSFNLNWIEVNSEIQMQSLSWDYLTNHIVLVGACCVPKNRCQLSVHWLAKVNSPLRRLCESKIRDRWWSTQLMTRDNIVLVDRKSNAKFHVLGLIFRLKER